MQYIIREIEEKDNKAVEDVIRSCLIEFGANRKGLAWADPNLGCFSKVYAGEKECYWVVEDEDKKIIGGAGIGKLNDRVCELQKMYFLPEARGTGVAKDLMKQALDFAKKYYQDCYIETLSNMVAANKFYQKFDFKRLDKPFVQTEHYACDVWYLKKLK